MPPRLPTPLASRDVRPHLITLPATCAHDRAMTLAQFRVLAELARASSQVNSYWLGISQHRLAQRLALHRNTVRESLAALERRGYIERSRCMVIGDASARMAYRVLLPTAPATADRRAS